MECWKNIKQVMFELSMMPTPVNLCDHILVAGNIGGELRICSLANDCFVL